MSKLTAKDYVDAQHSLGRAGFLAIKTLLDNNSDGVKNPSDIALLYGIDLSVVDIVATTSTYSEYETITRLEQERASLLQQLDAQQVKEARIKPKKWHYAVAGVILLGLLVSLVYGVIWLVQYVSSLF